MRGWTVQGTAGELARAARRRLESLVDSPWWIPRIVLLAWCLAFLFSVPGYERTGPDGVQYLRDKYFDVVQLTIDHTLLDMARIFPERTNPAKRTFRLTVPVFARLSHTGLVGALALNYLSAYLVLHLAALLAFRALGNRADAALVVVALAGTYFGTAAFKDIFGWFDSVAFALLLASMVQRRVAWRTLALVAAFFTDERALLVAPLTLLAPGPDGQPSASRQATAVAVGIALYAAIRLSLTTALGLATATEAIDLQSVRDHLPTLAAALWSGLEGGWILIFAGLWCLRREHGRQLATGLLAAAYVATYLASCFLVIDVTRSLAFASVGIVSLLVVLRDRIDRPRLRDLLMAAAVVSILAPNLFEWDYLDFELPLPLHLIVHTTSGPPW